jgi:hypothetical protein
MRQWHDVCDGLNSNNFEGGGCGLFEVSFLVLYRCLESLSLLILITHQIVVVVVVVVVVVIGNEFRFCF